MLLCLLFVVVGVCLPVQAQIARVSIPNPYNAQPIQPKKTNKTRVNSESVSRMEGSFDDWTKYRPYGGEFLKKALEELVDPILRNGKGKQKMGYKYPPPSYTNEENEFWNIDDKQFEDYHKDGADITFQTKLRRRCNNFLACETFVPVVEIENASARYNPSEINAIEKALGLKIVRKRNKK